MTKKSPDAKGGTLTVLAISDFAHLDPARNWTMPGLGKLTFDVIAKSDQPVVLGVTLLAAFFITLANLVVDLLYGVIDPRVRYS
ncbi:ABC transporter permease subunit [Nonomuraea sp. NPDC050536]|uniref:ABC transporter permease subunit n=1 Tax=Nonomuraea sp. NPDC050536 TaxID=3364366 RepID=UPI0037CAF8B6